MSSTRCPTRSQKGRENVTTNFTYESKWIIQVSQEGRSIFLEVIVSVNSKGKKKCICTCVLFRTVSKIAISLYSSKWLITKRHYVLFLIPVFIVQVTKLVHFTYIIQFRKFHRQDVKINERCNSSEDILCCSSECILTY
jgi:hypothetical protein